MLAVTLIWIYVLVTSYLLGFCFLSSLSGRNYMKHQKTGKLPKQYDIRYMESYVVAGIVIATVYAQVFSLFGGVGLGANIILALTCVVIAVYYRYELQTEFYEMKRHLTAKSNWALYLAIFLLMAYGASHGYMHYDSDLYHAQAIRWIEEYGIVKGLGNIHVRLAYNSSAFALSALYSMSFLGFGSFHVMSGFFALLLAWQCADIRNIFCRGHLVISDFARIMAIYYLFSVYDEIVAPASDYFLATTVFYIIIHWLDTNVRRVKSYVPYILLALLSVYAVTLKLSAAPMLLLSVIPIYRLLHDRTKESIKAFWISVALGFGIALPFLIRNVILSGWLLYPVTAINLFNVPWKIPKGVAEFDALEIKTFGRGYNDVAAFSNVPFKEWSLNWFKGLGAVNKGFIILDIIATIVFLVYFAYFIMAIATKRREKLGKPGKSKVSDLSGRSIMKMADFITVGATLILCLVFWFFSAPLIRYGVVYVWLTAAVVLGRLLLIVLSRLPDNTGMVINRVVSTAFLIWVIYKTAVVCIEDTTRFDPAYLVKQQDYGTYEVAEFPLGKDVFYYPTEGDRVGYDPFPAATHDLTGEVEPMGKNIRNGFRSIK